MSKEIHHDEISKKASGEHWCHTIQRAPKNDHEEAGPQRSDEKPRRSDRKVYPFVGEIFDPGDCEAENEKNDRWPE